MRILITAHGIRTFGHWQERLESLVKKNLKPGEKIEVINYKYGYFSVIAFLIPFLRWLVIRRFRREIAEICGKRKWARIDFVGHSFGTHVIAWALHGMRQVDRPRVHTIILSGSVLRTDFPWRDLIGSSVVRVINDCGSRDAILLLSQFLVLFTGMAGRTGFSGATGESFRNRFSMFGHSGYFEGSAGRSSNDYMRDHWLPLLTTDASVSVFDHRPPGSIVDGIAITLANNAEPMKLFVYLTPVLLITLWIFGLYETAEEQRRKAESGRLTIQGKLQLERSPGALPYAMWQGLQARTLQPSIETYTLLQTGAELLPLRQSFWSDPDQSEFHDVAIAENGDLIVLARSGRIERRDSKSGKLIDAIFTPKPAKPQSAFPDGVRHAVLSGTGMRAAVVEPDNSIKIISFTDDDAVFELSIDVDKTQAIGLDDVGNYIVHVDTSQRATIWSIATKSPMLAEPINLQPLSTQELSVKDVAVDGTGRLIAFMSGSVVGKNYRVWVVNAQTGESVRSVILDELVDHVAFDPSGTRLVASAGGIFYLVGLFEEAPPDRYPTGRSISGNAAFGRSGRFMATLSHGPTVRVWDTYNQTEVARLNHQGTALAAAFGADPKQLVVVGDTTGDDDWEASASVWDLSRTSRMREAFLVSSDLNARASLSSPAGDYVVISDDDVNQVRVHDLKSGRLLSRINDVRPSIASIHDLPARLTTWLDGEIATFSLPELDFLQADPGPKEHGGIGVLSPDGSLYATRHVRRDQNDRDQERSDIYAFQLADHSPVIRSKIEGFANKMVFSQDNRYLAVAMLKRSSGTGIEPLNEVLLFDLEQGDDPVSRIDYFGWPGGVSFSNDGKLLAISGGTSLLVLAIPSFDVMHKIPEELGIDSVALHPTGEFVATFSRDNLVRIHRTGNGTEVARRPLQRTAYGDARLFFVADGKTLVASADAAGGVFVWDWSEEEIVKELCSRLSHEFEHVSTSSGDAEDIWEQTCGSSINYQYLRDEE